MSVLSPLEETGDQVQHYELIPQIESELFFGFSIRRGSIRSSFSNLIRYYTGKKETLNTCS